MMSHFFQCFANLCGGVSDPVDAVIVAVVFVGQSAFLVLNDRLKEAEELDSVSRSHRKSSTSRMRRRGGDDAGDEVTSGRERGVVVVVVVARGVVTIPVVDAANSPDDLRLPLLQFSDRKRARRRTYIYIESIDEDFPTAIAAFSGKFKFFASLSNRFDASTTKDQRRCSCQLVVSPKS